MKIADKYVPQELEGKWYDYWLAGGYFHSEPDSRPSYTIVIPPPNVTGMLHMGHMLNNTLQDVLVRRARMNGMNACWVPGTDHASGYREIVALARGVPAPCLAVEGGARGDYPQTAPPAGRLVRLGAYRIHDGRGAFAQRHSRLRGSL